MNVVATISTDTLPAMVDRAAAALAAARTSAEVLEARDFAGLAYDAAKRAGRFAKAKGAHDEMIATALRMQGEALAIESRAKLRLADEYDAAQERGEVATVGKPVNVPDQNNKPTVEDLGLTRKDIHEARLIRDAETEEPGIVGRSIGEMVDRGEEPTKAALRKIVTDAALRGLRGTSRPRSDNRNPLYRPSEAFGVMASVTGHCQSLIDKLDEYSAEFIATGFVDEAMRGRNIATIVRCRDALSALLETINVE